MTRWLTLAEAATTAGRDQRTIRRWIDEGLLTPPDTEPANVRAAADLAARTGRYREDLVITAEKTKRARRGRPRKSATLGERETAL